MKRHSHIVALVFSSVFLSFNIDKKIPNSPPIPLQEDCIRNAVMNSIEEAIYNYIDTYKDLAIVEMYRSGIPASIILAQALHESNYGQSPLAQNANNHFGIKCKSYWFGQKYYHKDDDYDEEGNLTSSCFRSYNTGLESYVDHSNFLMTTRHYEKLFKYDRTDYVSWAYGLKECGYATDPKYAEKLIDKINKYYLNTYDSYESPYRTILKY